MSQLQTGTPTRTQKPGNNVYTVLVFIAVIALGVAVGVVWWRNVELTGDLQSDQAIKSPFHLVEQPGG